MMGLPLKFAASAGHAPGLRTGGCLGLENWVACSASRSNRSRFAERSSAAWLLFVSIASSIQGRRGLPNSTHLWVVGFMVNKG